MKKYRRFDIAYKQAIVQEIESGQRTTAQIAREENIASSLLDRWKKQIREGSLVERSTAKERQLERELDRYKKKVGELTILVDALKKIPKMSQSRNGLNGCVVTGLKVAESRKDVRS